MKHNKIHYVCNPKTFKVDIISLKFYVLVIKNKQTATHHNDTGKQLLSILSTCWNN